MASAIGTSSDACAPPPNSLRRSVLRIRAAKGDENVNAIQEPRRWETPVDLPSDDAEHEAYQSIRGRDKRLSGVHTRQL